MECSYEAPAGQPHYEPPLPDGFVEERLQVDRKRLEAMITGKRDPVLGFNLPEATEFFDRVQSQSGASVCWPSRLKIGAKTKKDPYVKVIGPPDKVRTASDLIADLLRVKKDRITLKMEIAHSAHSHIIGRGGKNTQDIMRETMCHIHFPDSNKHSEVEKNNQVSIAGSMTQVEHARQKLRMSAPVTVTVMAQIGSAAKVPSTASELQRSVGMPDLAFTLSATAARTFQCSIKGSVLQDHLIITTVDRLRTLLEIASPFAVRLAFEIRPALLHKSYGLFSVENVQRIGLCTQTQIQFLDQGPCLVINGAVDGVLAARKELTALLPVTLQFEKPPNTQLSKSLIRALETELSVQIAEKRKPIGNGAENTIVVRTHEANVVNAYAAHQRLSGPSGSLDALQQMVSYADGVPVQPTDTAPSMPVVTSNPARSIFQRSVSTVLSQAMSSSPPPPEPFDTKPKTVILQQPKSPDPEESPIAHSLLTGAKNIDLMKGEIWKIPTQRLNSDRDKMLFKANQVTYQADDTEHTRYPTGLWSGYGFSNSLPAELLKSGLQGIWESEAELPRGGFSLTADHQNVGGSTRERRPIVGRGPDETLQTVRESVPKPLASVREEEELSDYSNSTISSPSATNRYQQAVKIKRPFFAASTSLFESTPPVSNDVSWDIRVFTEPAMVLAQLGCNEYLPQFRDQEIDMQAFLLLDEQNLKDIGVSTMGARKKIFNAILKLRESAKRHGYSL